MAGTGGKRKGAGRKTSYRERATFQMLEKMFFDKLTKEEVREMLSKGEYSIKDSFVAKAFAGGDKQQIALFNRLFPEKMIIDGKVTVKPTPILSSLKTKNVRANPSSTKDTKPDKAD